MICEFCKANYKENCRELYDQLAFYTFNHKDQEFFIHQYVVDAYGAQHLTEDSKSIGAAFTILGLYLASEKGYTGKQVQLAHIQLGETKKEYPKFMLPENRGVINAEKVLKAKEGDERDEMIKQWVASTWEAFKENEPIIVAMLKEFNFKEIT